MLLSEFTIQFWERGAPLVDVKREDVVKSQFNFNLVPVNRAILSLSSYVKPGTNLILFNFLLAHQLII